MTTDSGRHRGVAPRPVPPQPHQSTAYAVPGGSSTPGAALAPAAPPTTRPTSTPPGIGSRTTGTPTAEDLLLSIRQLCEAHTNAHLARVAASDAPTEAERAHHQARADYWNQTASTRYQDLHETVTGLLPHPAHLERFMPIRPLPNGTVELHARDQRARPVVVQLTGAQALTISTHLAAYAAISLDRTGTKINDLLPPIKAAPPFTTRSPSGGTPGRA